MEADIFRVDLEAFFKILNSTLQVKFFILLYTVDLIWILDLPVGLRIARMVSRVSPVMQAIGDPGDGR